MDGAIGTCYENSTSNCIFNHFHPACHHFDGAMPQSLCLCDSVAKPL
jgi:hypothetical protein